MPVRGWRFATSALGLLLTAAACSGDDDDDARDTAATSTSASYALLSSSDSADVDSTYVSLLDTVGPQTIDYGRSREFAGTADLWVRDGFVFVAESDARTITKFAVEGHNLVEQDKLGFGDFGLSSLGFYLNVFISADKAYLSNGVSEYIVWNPTTMQITGSVKFPELAAQGTLEPFGSYMDRAAVVRDGRLYQPIYWTDETYFQYTPNSKIAVFDVAEDKFLELLDAPCPGLDYATQTDAGEVYFSTWIFAPGAAAVLDQPATCVVKLSDDGSAVEKAFDVADITDGREGGAFLYRGSDRAMLSVLDAERGRAAGQREVTEIAYGANWRFWSYDLKSQAATEITDIPWNAGSAYPMRVDGKALLLVPGGDYASTTLYDLSDEQPEEKFEVRGWATRLFQLN